MNTSEHFRVFVLHAIILVGKFLHFDLEVFHELKVNRAWFHDDPEMKRSIPVCVVCVTARLIHDF